MVSGPGDGREVKVTFDVLGEQVVLAAAVVSREERVRLTRLIPPDTFLAPEHAAAWKWLAELERRGLDYDPATLRQIAGTEVDVALLEQIAEARPDVPPNLDFHVRALFWDRRRATALEGPVTVLVDLLRDPRAEPSGVEAAARQVASSLSGGGEVRKYLRDGDRLAEEQAKIIEARANGQGCYPYGIDGLDYYESDEAAKTHGRYEVERYEPGTRFRRMLPGAAPGQTTVVTGLSGGNKTTIAANLIVSLARMKRRVLLAAWEPGSGMSLELLGSIVTGVRRADLITGQASKDDRERHAEAMRRIAKVVKFMDNPFATEGSSDRWKGTDANLDLFAGYVADSGCDVVVADLWNRLLVREDPSEEASALFRQQAIFGHLGVHGILLHQMRLKDVEQRADKKPTRESLKGSGAYIEMPDTVIGVHYPAMFKPVDPNRLEVYVLKQRYGVWPLGVELDFDPSVGRVSGGRSIAFEAPVAAENAGGAAGMRVNRPPPYGQRGGRY